MEFRLGGTCGGIIPLSRDFKVFCFARLVALAGSAVTGVALPLLVLRASQSYFMTSMVTVTMTVPYLLFGLLSGAVADRVPRRYIILVAQSASACALLSIPFIQLVGDVSSVYALGVGFVCGTSFVWFDSACFGAIPVLVSKQQLVTANTVLWVSGSVIEATFPALAGVMVAILGAAYAIGIEGFSLIISIILFSRIMSSIDAFGHRKIDDGSLTLRQMVREGIKFIWYHDLVRILTLLGAISSLINGMIIGLLAAISRDILSIPEGDPRSGYAWVAVSLGTIVGATLLPMLRRLFRLGIVTLLALSNYPVVLVTFVLMDVRWIRFGLLGCWGAFVSIVVLNGISSRQEVTPISMQSRVNTTARMIAWGGTPFGALLGGTISSLWGIDMTLIVAAVIAICVSILAFQSTLVTADIGKGSNEI